MSSISLRCLEVGLLDHMVSACLTLKENSGTFPKWLYNFISPPTGFSLIFLSLLLGDVYWYLTAL